LLVPNFLTLSSFWPNGSFASLVLLCFFPSQCPSRNFTKPYWAIRCESTFDTRNNKSQRSTCLKNVTNKGEPQTCKHVTKTVNDFGFEFKYIGYKYSRAAVIVWQSSGPQIGFQGIYHEAIFTHCYSHVLNLILHKSASVIKKCNIFNIVLLVNIFFQIIKPCTKAIYWDKDYLKLHIPDGIVIHDLSIQCMQWEYSY
jgi:hypothetical protein